MGWLFVVGFRLKPFPTTARHTASRLGVVFVGSLGSTTSEPVFVTVNVRVPVDPGATAPNSRPLDPGPKSSRGAAVTWGTPGWELVLGYGEAGRVSAAVRVDWTSLTEVDVGGSGAPMAR